MKTAKRFLCLLTLIALLLGAVSCSFGVGDQPSYIKDLESVPEFDGSSYVIINNNIPFFEEDEITDESFERYSELDGLGRCGAAVASIGVDLMPTGERDFSLQSVKPSGWLNASYDCVSGGYLYHRAHLIGWQLTGETTNEKNLITGTQFMNVKGMMKFENLVAAYIKETGNHVMYRVTPIYDGNNLVARGVLWEAWSVEDNGAEICYNLYFYNNQPGVQINYATGASKLDDGVPFPDDEGVKLPDAEGEPTFIINTSTRKFHTTDCRYASSANAEEFYGEREELTGSGYEACKVCNP